MVGLCDELVIGVRRRCGREACPSAALRTTALTNRNDFLGVSYTRGVSAPELEHGSAVGESTSKELGQSGTQFEVGARRQWGIP